MIDLKEIEFTPADSEQVEDARKAIARHLNRRNQKDKEYERNFASTSKTAKPDTSPQGNGKD